MASTTQEDPKNMALLFFLDHLMQKSGTRTIHDLSCQFGARGFSPEMRESVGGTQEGLSDFLGQFPSLFKVEDDTVSLTMYDLSSGGGANPLLSQLPSRDRDYDREAVEFFEKKLHKFGPELQIKSLLGHRSQAAPEVRLVSGRHVKDFTEFLSTHTAFIVEGDRVRMTNMPEPTQPECDIDPDTGLTLAGAKAKLVAVEFLKSSLEEQDGVPLPMESLYQLFCGRFTHAVRQDVATNPKELLQFLKLNRNIFFIRSNKVSLVKNRPEGEMNGTSPGLNDSESDGSDTSSIIVPNNLIDRITVVESLRAAQQALQSIANAGVNLMDKPAVSFDFKLVNIGHDFIVLVAVGLWDGKVYLFDCAHSDSILKESGLKDLLESPDWIKVIHDCRKVSAILYNQYGILLDEVYDTQVANTIITQAKLGKPIEEVRPIPFYHVQRLYHPESLLLSDTNPRKTSKIENQWSSRPLTNEMIVQSCEEAAVLMPFIYNAINKQLKPEMTYSFDELCYSQIHAYLSKDSMPIMQRRERKAKTSSLTNGISNLAVTQNGASDVFSRQNGKSQDDRRNGSPVIARKMVDGCTQTLSTGEITMHKVYTERNAL